MPTMSNIKMPDVDIANLREDRINYFKRQAGLVR